MTPFRAASVVEFCLSFVVVFWIIIVLRILPMGSPVVTRAPEGEVLGLQGVAPGINFDLEFLLGEWEGKASLEARDMDTKLLSAPGNPNNTLARKLITSSGWPFVSAVLSQMAHLVANITLNSASIEALRFLVFLTVVGWWLLLAVVGVGVTVVVVVESSSVI
ncbi:hypothetical protein Tco_1221256 [Tanacetum coccineum]